MSKSKQYLLDIEGTSFNGKYQCLGRESFLFLSFIIYLCRSFGEVILRYFKRKRDCDNLIQNHHLKKAAKYVEIDRWSFLTIIFRRKCSQALIAIFNK